MHRYIAAILITAAAANAQTDGPVYARIRAWEVLTKRTETAYEITHDGTNAITLTASGAAQPLWVAEINAITAQDIASATAIVRTNEVDRISNDATWPPEQRAALRAVAVRANDIAGAARQTLLALRALYKVLPAQIQTAWLAQMQADGVDLQAIDINALRDWDADDWKAARKAILEND